MEADKELNDTLIDFATEITGMRPSYTAELKSFEEAKTALLTWRDKAVVAARKDELLKMTNAEGLHQVTWKHLQARLHALNKLKAIMDIKE